MAISKRLRYEVLRRDNHACRYCGAAAPEIKAADSTLREIVEEHGERLREAFNAAGRSPAKEQETR